MVALGRGKGRVSTTSLTLSIWHLAIGCYRSIIPVVAVEHPIVVDVIAATVNDCDRVQGQLLEQSNDLIIVSDIVPRESKVFLVLLESIDIPVEVTGLDALGLVAQIFQNRLLGDWVQTAIRIQQIQLLCYFGIRPPRCRIGVFLLDIVGRRGHRTRWQPGFRTHGIRHAVAEGCRAIACWHEMACRDAVVEAMASSLGVN
jgi:hypothetical protein